MKFTPGNHQYRLDGAHVPSVTTIIGILDKPALMHWAAGLAAKYVMDRVPELMAGDQSILRMDPGDVFRAAKAQARLESDKAKSHGTDVHAACEDVVRMTYKFGLPDDMPALRARIKSAPPQVRSAASSFKRFLSSFGVKRVIAVEQMLFSDGPRFCGTCDVVVDDGKGPFVLDIKTSNGFYEPEMPLQLAAYCRGLTERSGVAHLRAGIVRIDKASGAVEFADYSGSLPVADEMFRHLCSFYTLMRGVKAWR